ncbi:MAG: DUF4783 domain-containing protein [Flavobacteriales bacterium]|jgi:hypothetical protein|nr:DUF4783 domain-containing protein [Bacteroidota bacterium]MDP4587769.1 DUF4783 domain-containing protein [Flavobacteriales bacterium]MDP4952766.1 DUF4783 domain-containing protein [Flavobacteriales bacterium]
MKLMLTLVLFSFSALVFAQEDAAAKVSWAIENGDALVLQDMMMSSVDLSILDDEDMYPADEAVRKLSSFFKQHPPQSFTVKHKGTSKLDDHYRIGTLQTKKGTFRVTFFLKKTPSGMMIKQIRIEEDED